MIKIERIDIAKLAAQAADDKKAQDIIILDVHPITLIADYFIICNGNSSVQVKAICDEVFDRLNEQGIAPLHREGYNEGKWILLDYGDIVVHIFGQEERDFYKLERLWGDAQRVDF